MVEVQRHALLAVPARFSTHREAAGVSCAPWGQCNLISGRRSASRVQLGSLNLGQGSRCVIFACLVPSRGQPCPPHAPLAGSVPTSRILWPPHASGVVQVHTSRLPPLGLRRASPAPLDSTSPGWRARLACRVAWVAIRQRRVLRFASPALSGCTTTILLGFRAPGVRRGLTRLRRARPLASDALPGRSRALQGPLRAVFADQEASSRSRRPLSATRVRQDRTARARACVSGRRASPALQGRLPLDSVAPAAIIRRVWRVELDDSRPGPVKPRKRHAPPVHWGPSPQATGALVSLALPMSSARRDQRHLSRVDTILWSATGHISTPWMAGYPFSSSETVQTPCGARLGPGAPNGSRATRGFSYPGQKPRPTLWCSSMAPFRSVMVA